MEVLGLAVDRYSQVAERSELEVRSLEVSDVRLGYRRVEMLSAVVIDQQSRELGIKEESR